MILTLNEEVELALTMDPVVGYWKKYISKQPLELVGISADSDADILSHCFWYNGIYWGLFRHSPVQGMWIKREGIWAEVEAPFAFADFAAASSLPVLVADDHFHDIWFRRWDNEE